MKKCINFYKLLNNWLNKPYTIYITHIHGQGSIPWVFSNLIVFFEYLVTKLLTSHMELNFNCLLNSLQSQISRSHFWNFIGEYRVLTFGFFCLFASSIFNCAKGALKFVAIRLSLCYKIFFILKNIHKIQISRGLLTNRKPRPTSTMVPLFIFNEGSWWAMFILTMAHL